MTTDEEKAKLAKLLQGLETPDVIIPERCRALVKEFHARFGKKVEQLEEQRANGASGPDENPYRVDKKLLEDTDRKLKELIKAKRPTRTKQPDVGLALAEKDPQRPWRTHTSKENLLRINNELKHHHEKAHEGLAPPSDEAMRCLIAECQEESKKVPLVEAEKLNETIKDAKKALPNFQYRKIINSTATAILPAAHDEVEEENAVNT